MPDSLRKWPSAQPAEKTVSGSSPSTSLRHIFLFSVANFFFWAALYLYVPVFPVYAQSLGASLSMVGIIIAAYSIPQLLFRIPVGMLFDSLSRRKPLLAGGLLMTAAGALGLALAPDAWFLFLARAITGIGAATWVAFVVYFMAYYPRDRAYRAIGIINFVQGIAVVAATGIGGFIAEASGVSQTFWGAAFLGVAGLVVLLLTREATVSQTEPVSWQSFKMVASYPPLLIASFMGILSQFANWAGLFGFIPIYATRIGASNADLGFITMLALASSAVAALVVASLVKRWGNSLTIVSGSVLIGSAMLVVPLVHDVSLLMVVMVVSGFGRGVLATILMSLSVRAVAPRQKATAMGIYQATYAVGMILGPVVSGSLADSQGLVAVFYLSASLCLVIAGMALLPIVARYQKD